MARGDDDDVKDQELQIKIQENERLQREVSATNKLILSVLQQSSFDDFLTKMIWPSSYYPVMEPP